MPARSSTSFPPRWLMVLVLGLITYGATFWLRMLEWPSWQEVEFRLGNEMLLATHDAYHWVAGAEGFSFGAGHPMSELLRVLALVTGQEPAGVAFWLPPIMASLVALLVFAWATCMGSMEAGVCAGVLASLAPGFLARTMLGYSDTDLVTLFLPLLVGLAPACWVMRFLRHPLALPLRLFRKPLPVTLEAPIHVTADMLALHWIVLLGLSGFMGWWAQQWHSVFPYLAVYNAGLLGFMALCLAASREDMRAGLFAAACFALPLLVGPWGLLPSVLYVLAGAGEYFRDWRTNDTLTLYNTRIWRFCTHPATLALFWGLVFFELMQGDIFETMSGHIQGYLKRAGDPAGGSDTGLVFPSVAQSIIEIQDLSLSEMLVYFHPWPAVAVLGMAGFMVVLCARSGALFLLPLVGLAILSTRMGGRMVMFGSPIVALGLVLPVDWLACALGDVRAGRSWIRGLRVAVLLLVMAAAGAALLPNYADSALAFWDELGSLRWLIGLCAVLMILLSLGRHRGIPLFMKLDAFGPHFLYRAASVTLMLALVIPPLAELIPAMTHGPIINRRHAGALRAIQKSTPENAMLWLWWDWGYSAHHFARRNTIADGAQHGGPSLYLPAAVFSTDSPRLARQIIKYTALHDNVPGDVFKNLNAEQADALMKRLADPQFPLINAAGTQYVVVSYDMLNLGFWISTFGNWDFLKREGKGYAISIVPQQLSYRLDQGRVLVHGQDDPIAAATMDIFEDGRLVHRDYSMPPGSFANPEDEKAWRTEAEQRRNIHFLFNRVTGEKLVVDDRMYNSLMIRLLVGSPSNPTVQPYFRLIYDNVFCRVYEVL